MTQVRTYTTKPIEFHNRPEDESVYCYPHRYRIELRHTMHGWEQRHILMWDSGETREQKWIRSFDHSEPGALKGYTETTSEQQSA